MCIPWFHRPVYYILVVKLKANLHTVVNKVSVFVFVRPRSKTRPQNVVFSSAPTRTPSAPKTPVVFAQRILPAPLYLNTLRLLQQQPRPAAVDTQYLENIVTQGCLIWGRPPHPTAPGVQVFSGVRLHWGAAAAVVCDSQRFPTEQKRRQDGKTERPVGLPTQA